MLGAYVTETSENTFPRLPVRQTEKVFVWFTRSPSAAAFDKVYARLEASADWRNGDGASLARLEERPAQTLYLAPTPRSALR